VASRPEPYSLIRFGTFELDADSCELRKAGVRLKIPPQPAQLLLLLAGRPGQIVTREEIRECLWGRNTYVDFERGINFCVNQIRVALGDDPEKPRYIETLPRRGYRFVAQITSHPPAELTVHSTKISPRFDLAAGNDGDDVAAAARMHTVSSIDHASVSLVARRRLVRASGLALALLAAAFIWSTRRRISAPSDFRLRELTANSSENRVRSGAISPDGKYLAYADLTSMHVKLIETGETQTIPRPEALKDSRVYWETVGWFPDGTRFLANTALPPELSSFDHRPSIWTVTLLGGAPRKLRDDAEAWSVSPDGSLISFGTGKGRFGDREVWLMGSNGENPQKLYDTDENSAIHHFTWLPGGQRVAYIRTDRSGDTLLSRDLRGGSPTTILSPPEMAKVTDYLLLPDGRMIYAVRELKGNNTCNYWEMQINSRTGEPVGRPWQVTNWAGFCLARASVTANGRRLAFVQWTFYSSAYVADLEANRMRISKPKRFTLNNSWDYPADWTVDSKALILLSNRDGHLDIYKQSLNEDTAQPLVTGAHHAGFPHVSPDGAWLLYTVPTNERSSSTTQIMRVPITGGAPQVVATALGDPQIACTRSPADFCVVQEHTQDRKLVMFTALDPLKGRGRELFRTPLDAYRNYLAWDISPDGKRIAIQKFPEGPYQILSLHGDELQQITVKGWRSVQSCDWSADSKGLFVSAPTAQGSVLLYVDLRGNSRVVWEQPVALDTYARPSPDGRHLAIQGRTVDGNIWMMENF
jgi:Tol biopolymer transport system component/DNA-binding winged helix-turn-helix (wHTH) protein